MAKRRNPLVAVHLAVAMILAAVLPARMSAGGHSVYFYDDFDDGNFDGWLAVHPGTNDPTTPPDIVPSPQGYALRGVGSGYTQAVEGLNVTLLRPLALANVRSLAIEFRAKSGPTAPNAVFASLGRGTNMYRCADYGESNRKADFASLVGGVERMFRHDIGDRAYEWHDFAWLRNDDGWWSLAVDGIVEWPDFYKDDKLTSFEEVTLHILRNESEVEWVRISDGMDTIPQYNIVPGRIISADYPEGLVYRDDGFWVLKAGISHAQDALQHYCLMGHFLGERKNLPGVNSRYGVAWDGTHWWVSDNNYGPEHIYKCDEDLNVVQRYEWPYAGPWGLEWAQGYLWVCDASTDTIYRVTVGDSNFISIEPWSAANPEPADLAWDGRHMWSCTGPNGGFDTVVGQRFIYKHDAQGGISEVWRYPPADDPGAPSGGTATGIAFANGQLWYCDYGKNQIIEALPDVIPPAPCRLERSTRLSAADTDAGDYFGMAVDMDGDYCIVGAYGAGSGDRVGAAYVFKRERARWLEQAILVNPTGADRDYFGGSVAISGDYCVVSASGADTVAGIDAGMAYVYQHSGALWIQVARLTASDAAAGDVFGARVDIDGDTIIVGAPYDDDGAPNRGSVYVFVRPANGWTDMTETAKLTASDGGLNDRFGNAVSISGDTIVAGASYHDGLAGGNSGAAYIFEKPAGGWTHTTETARLLPDDNAAGDEFGTSVCVGDGVAIVGAWYDDVSASNSGSAYVFTRGRGGWEDAAVVKLTASNGAAGDWFGVDVSIDGSRAIVGAFYDDGGGINSGTAYLFEKPPAGWQDATETAELTRDDGHSGRQYGQRVCVSGDMAVIGAPLDNLAGTAAGAVYIFTCSAMCDEYAAADLNRDCYVNLADLAILMQGWLRCTNQLDPNCE